MAILTTIQNPFNRYDRTVEVIEHNLPIYKHLKDFGEDIEIIVSLNGNITENYEYILKEHDHIGVIPIPAGGGKGGKNPIALVAMVALTVATAGAGSAVLASYGFSSMGAAFAAGSYGAMALAAGASMVVGIAGSMLINQLMPSTSASSSSASLESESPTYAFGNSTNVAQEGTYLPLLIGKRRVTPPIKGYYLSSSGSEQRINILYSVCEGLIDSITDIEINNQPISSYQDVSYETTLGAVNQAQIGNFRDSITTVDVSRTLNELNAEAIVTTLSNTVNEVDVCITLATGLFSVGNDGNYSSNSISFSISYRKVGTTTWTEQGYTISGVYKTVHRVTYSLKVPTAGKYEIKVVRTSAFNSTSNVSNNLLFDYINEVIYDDFTYPGEALLSVNALATDQLSGSFPTVTCLAQNIYADGYTNMPKNNPAWACYYLLKYNGVEDENIDLVAFEEWATWCDEKGYKVCLYIDTLQELQTVLDMISLIGRATVVQFGSVFAPIINKPVTIPVQKFLFTTANVVNGELQLDYIPYQDRANCIEMTYYDETDSYSAKTVTVQSDDYNATTIENKTSITLYACSEKATAAKLAKLYLNQNRYLSEMATFTAQNDCITCKVGDIVEVGAKYLTNTLLDGRLKEVSGDFVQLDGFVDFQQGEEYEITMRFEDDTIASFTYTHIGDSGLSDIIELVDVPIVDNPINVVYAIGTLGEGATNSYRVTNITRASDFTRKITALEYNPTVYEDDVPIIVEPVTIIDSVQNLKAQEQLVQEPNGVAYDRLILTWVSFTNDVKKVYIDNVYIGETKDNRFEITNDLLEGKLYTIRVNNSEITYQFIGIFTPYPVKNLEQVSLNGRTTITWDKDLTFNFNYYEVFINNDRYTTQIPTLTVSLNTGTYFVKVRTYLLNGASSQFTSKVFSVTTPSFQDLIANNYLLEQAFKDGNVAIFVGEGTDVSAATEFDLWRVAPTSLTLGELTYASDQLRLLRWIDFQTDENAIYKYFDGTEWLICNGEQRFIIEKSLGYVSTQAIADGAYRIFNTTPFIPYDVGDLWLFGDSIRVSTVRKLAGTFSTLDWVDSTDTSLNISPMVDNTQVVKDGTGTTEVVQAGLNSTPTKLGFWDGIRWRSYIGANGTFSFENGDETSYVRYDGADLTIKGKIIAEAGSEGVGGSTSFYQTDTPTAKEIGDLWTNSVTNVKKIWNGTAWVADNLALAINNGTTTINGGLITANTITSDKMGANRLVNVSAYNSSGVIVEENVTMDINFATGYIYIK